MNSDSMVNGSVHAFSKDFGKKKRTNRSAKLKQCKLDARREQWLSQVKNLGCKEELTLPLINERENQSLGISKMRSIGEVNEESDSNLQKIDLESLLNSPTSIISGDPNSRKSRTCSSSSSSRCCSTSVSEEEEDEDDECMDDWEAIADALTASENCHHPHSEPPIEPKAPILSEVGVLKSECNCAVPKVVGNGRAWRPDDAFRPQSLPSLSKQYSFPMNVERRCGRGGVSWVTSCPICYEDLDHTDSSFLPCLCGFRLCLFCHKRILEADGRCPGCRKEYDPAKGETFGNEGAPPFRLTRSLSMSTSS